MRFLTIIIFNLNLLVLSLISSGQSNFIALSTRGGEGTCWQPSDFTCTGGRAIVREVCCDMCVVINNTPNCSSATNANSVNMHITFALENETTQLKITSSTVVFGMEFYHFNQEEACNKEGPYFYDLQCPIQGWTPQTLRISINFPGQPPAGYYNINMGMTAIHSSGQNTVCEYTFKNFLVYNP